jgi:hypothetical protein
LPLLLMSLAVAAALPARGADDVAPRPRVGADPAKAKAWEAERQRLIAKLRIEAPKVDDDPLPPSSITAPLFHRYDRPFWPRERASSL